MTRLLSELGNAAYRHLRCRLLQSISTVIVNNITAAAEPERFAYQGPICYSSMAIVYDLLFLVGMFYCTSILEFDMLVVAYVLLYVLKLIIIFSKLWT